MFASHSRVFSCCRLSRLSFHICSCRSLPYRMSAKTSRSSQARPRARRCTRGERGVRRAMSNFSLHVSFFFLKNKKRRIRKNCFVFIHGCTSLFTKYTQKHKYAPICTYTASRYARILGIWLPRSRRSRLLRVLWARHSASASRTWQAQTPPQSSLPSSHCRCAGMVGVCAAWRGEGGRDVFESLCNLCGEFWLIVCISSCSLWGCKWKVHFHKYNNLFHAPVSSALYTLYSVAANYTSCCAVSIRTFNVQRAEIVFLEILRELVSRNGISVKLSGCCWGFFHYHWL